MDFDSILKSHGFILGVNTTCDTWIHPQTRMIIMNPKENRPYIFHLTMDPSMDYFETPEELNTYLNKELIHCVLHS